MVKEKKPKWQELLDRFELAVIEYAWLGSQHPSDHNSIEREYKRSKKALADYLKKGGEDEKADILSCSVVGCFFERG